MAQDPSYLIWIDMEMSGLNPEADRVLEIAIVVTDSQLLTVAEAPLKIVHQPDEVLDRMDSWNRSTVTSCGSVTTSATSRTRSASGFKPLISMSIQIK